MIVNGSLEGFFGGSRGLCQGNSLSPFLFVIVMEALSRMMRELVERDSIEGFDVGGGGGGGVCILHLLFADDAFILCGAVENQFCNLRCLFLCFEAVLGLKINLTKSETIHIGSVENVQELADILECRVSSLPITYLVLPLGARFKSIHI